MFGGKLEKIEHYKQKGKLDKLEVFTKSDDAKIRAAAYSAIGTIEKEGSNNMLTAGLNDPDPEVRMAIAQGLAHVGTSHDAELIRHRMEKETDQKIKDAFQIAVDAARTKR